MRKTTTNQGLLAVFLVKTLFCWQCCLAQTRDATELENLQADNKATASLINIIANQSPNLGREVALSSEQCLRLKYAIDEFSRNRQKLERANYYKREFPILELQAKGDRRYLEKRHKYDQEIAERERKQLENILNNTLLLFQIERVKQIVKQRVLISSSEVKDEFVLALAVAMNLEFSEKELDEIEQTLNGVRKKYLEKLLALEKKYFAESMKCIDPENRGAFKRKFGEPYFILDELLEQKVARKETKIDPTK